MQGTPVIQVPPVSTVAQQGQTTPLVPELYKGLLGAPLVGMVAALDMLAFMPQYQGARFDPLAGKV